MRFLIALVVAMQVTPIAAEDGREALILGIGRTSCASWLASQRAEAEGSAWLLGFWSGANVWGDSGTVGSTSDALGIIESVKKLCRDDPANTLMNAASKFYYTLKQKGR